MVQLLMLSPRMVIEEFETLGVHTAARELGTATARSNVAQRSHCLGVNDIDHAGLNMNQAIRRCVRVHGQDGLH